jgi:hypothetical protein
MRTFQPVETFVDNLPGKIIENNGRVHTYLVALFPQ